MKSISLFVLFWASINIHAVDNLRIPDIRSLGMGGNGVTQSVLFNPALVSNIKCCRPSCGKKYRSSFPQMSESCLFPLTNC